MKFIPTSSAACTDSRASRESTVRNSCPSDDAPKLSTGSFSPVLPRTRYSMRSFLLPEILPERVDRPLCRLVRVGIRQRLGRDIAVVTNRTKGRDNGRIVDVAAAGRPAIGIDEMNMANVPAPRAERRG